MQAMTDVWTFTENPPEHVKATAELWHWSTNYDAGRGPFALYLDLIGYSYEEFGQGLHPITQGEDPAGTLGYTEIGKLAAALEEYANRPTDVREWVTELLGFDDA